MDGGKIILPRLGGFIMLILHFQQTQEQSHSASAKRSMEAAPDPVSLVMCKDSAKTLWSRTLGQVNEDKGYIIIYIYIWDTS